MKADIVSLDGVLFEGDISSLNVKTKVGEITILPGHRPLVTVLDRGEARVTKINGEKEIFLVKEGFLEVDVKNKITMLVNA